MTTQTTTPKVALTGATGQDGAYLSGLVLAKGYEMYGIKPRSAHFNIDPIAFAAKKLGIDLRFEAVTQRRSGVVAALRGDKAKCKVGDVVMRVDPRYYRPSKFRMTPVTGCGTTPAHLRP